MGCGLPHVGEWNFLNPSPMNKILHLEALRGIAAVSVVLLHYKINSLLFIPFVQHAWIMVDFFFVLSGYLICLRYRDRITGLSSFAEFIKRRFLRLYPLHLLMLMVFCVFEIARYAYFVSTGNAMLEGPPFSLNNASSFFTNLFLLQMLVDKHSTFNIPSWSIAVEFQVYILFALTLVLFGRRTRLRVLLGIVLMAIASRSILESGFEFPQNGLARCVFSFMLGAIACEAEAHLWPARMTTGSFVPAALVAVICVMTSWAKDLSNAVLLAFPFLCAALILSLNTCYGEARVLKILRHRYLVFLGTISYGIYMIHSAVWWGMRELLYFTLGVDIPPFLDIQGNVLGVPLATAVHLAGLAATISLAAASYRWFEKPIMEYYGSSRRVASAPEL